MWSSVFAHPCMYLFAHLYIYSLIVVPSRAADLEHAAWHAFALSKELDATLYDVIEVHDAEKEAVLSK